jgi:hypothetical protein
MIKYSGFITLCGLRSSPDPCNAPALSSQLFYLDCLTLKAKALWSFEMLELASQQHSTTCIFSSTDVETSNFMHCLDNDWY